MVTLRSKATAVAAYFGSDSSVSAIEILVDEHRLITRVVNVLNVLDKRLEVDHLGDENVFTDVLDFFRIFVDKNHHAKEEQALFPTLERLKINPEGCTIQSLKNEHEQARTLAMTLADAVGKYKTDSKVTISETIRSLISLHNDHIWRENILLFPVAEKTLQASELNDVSKGYIEVEKSLGTDFRGRFERLVNALESLQT